MLPVEVAFDVATTGTLIVHMQVANGTLWRLSDAGHCSDPDGDAGAQRDVARGELTQLRLPSRRSPHDRATDAMIALRRADMLTTVTVTAEEISQLRRLHHAFFDAICLPVIFGAETPIEATAATSPDGHPYSRLLLHRLPADPDCFRNFGFLLVHHERSA